MRAFFLSSTVSLLIPLCTLAAEAGKPTLEEVANFPEQQVTGVGVSKDGRVFVNFPYWADPHKVSVAELDKAGVPLPYPDELWNAKEGDPAKRFICVQSVVVDDKQQLWILDPASPKMAGVVKGGAKLVQVDLSINKVMRTYVFDEKAAPEKSYLNDVRIDTKNGHAFITESGVGSLVVLNLETGKARRVLAGHPSTLAEAGTELIVDGLKPKDEKTGTSPMFHADGIALDAKNGWLYYHALTGYTLYKIKTSDLTNEALTEEQLGEKVVKVAKTPAPDGMLEDKEGRVYLAAFEKNAISRFDPATGKTTTIIEDDRLQWPDTMSWGPDGLYLTTSQIHRMPKNNGGKNLQKGPFAVYRVKVAE